MSPCRTTLQPYQNVTFSVMRAPSPLPFVDLVRGELKPGEGLDPAEKSLFLARRDLPRRAERTEGAHASDAHHLHCVNALGTCRRAASRLRAYLEPRKRFRVARLLAQQIQHAFHHLLRARLCKRRRIRSHGTGLKAGSAARAARQRVRD